MAKDLSILQNFRSSLIKREPFPYFVIENALPSATYEKLAASYPSEALIFQNHRRKKAGEVYRPNARYDLPASQVISSPSLELGIWREFVEYHTSQEFLDEVLLKLGDFISISHPNLISLLQAKSPTGKPRSGIRRLSDQSENCEIALDCQVGINSPVTQKPSSVRSAHLDDAVELYAGLFYLRHPEDAGTGGDLEIYAWKDPARKVIGEHNAIAGDIVAVKNVVTYGANKFALLLNSLDGIHGVTVRNVTPFPRRLVNIIAEVYPSVENLFDVRPFLKAPRFIDQVKSKLGFQHS
jgi:hypothetical protein